MYENSAEAGTVGLEIKEKTVCTKDILQYLDGVVDGDGGVDELMQVSSLLM